jgi:hypothetical protein
MPSGQSLRIRVELNESPGPTDRNEAAQPNRMMAIENSSTTPALKTLLTAVSVQIPIPGGSASMQKSKEYYEFWRRFLILSNCGIVVLGLLVAFAGDSFFFELHNAGTRAVFFDGESLPENSHRLKGWLFGIIGGTIVGFHVLMIFIALFPMKQNERWAYVAMWCGLLSWFTVDSIVSIYFGALYNVYLINLVALVLIGLPLAMLYPGFRKDRG